MSEEALKIAEKRREVKGKGEKESYTHLNAEFQRIARRDKKAVFLARSVPSWGLGGYPNKFLLFRWGAVYGVAQSRT